MFLIHIRDCKFPKSRTLISFYFITPVGPSILLCLRLNTQWIFEWMYEWMTVIWTFTENNPYPSGHCVTVKCTPIIHVVSICANYCDHRQTVSSCTTLLLLWKHCGVDAWYPPRPSTPWILHCSCFSVASCRMMTLYFPILLIFLATSLKKIALPLSL